MASTKDRNSSCLLIMCMFFTLFLVHSTDAFHRAHIKLLANPERPVAGKKFEIKIKPIKLNLRDPNLIVEYRWMLNGLTLINQRTDTFKTNYFEQRHLGKYQGSLIIRRRLNSYWENTGPVLRTAVDSKVIMYPMYDSNVLRLVYDGEDEVVNLVANSTEKTMILSEAEKNDKINLYFNGEVLTPITMFFLGIEEQKKVYTRVYNIRKVTEDLNGQFKAVFEKDPDLTAYLKINVYKPLSYIEVGDMVVSVLKGEIVEHHCTMENIPGVTVDMIKWYYKPFDDWLAERVPLSARPGWIVRKIAGSKFTQFIRKQVSTRDDSGYYTCEISNASNGRYYSSTGELYVLDMDLIGRSSKSYIIDVQVSPKITIDTLNKKVTLTATILPPPSIKYSQMEWTWYKGDVKISREFYVKNVLTIREFKSNAFGKYRVSVRFTEPKQYETVLNGTKTITLEGNLKNLVYTERKSDMTTVVWEIKKNFKRTIVCKQAVLQGPKITWYLGKRELDANLLKVLNLKIDGKNLIVNELTEQHRGLYRCNQAAYTGYIRVEIFSKTEHFRISFEPQIVQIRRGYTYKSICQGLNLNGQPTGRPIIMEANKNKPGKGWGIIFKKFPASSGSQAIIEIPNIQQNMIVECKIGSQTARSLIEIQTVCGVGFRTCPGTSICLPANLFCDGRPDCEDGADENPRYCNDCDPIMKRCGNSKSLYAFHWKCDGEKDCLNAFDESNCGSAEERRCYSKTFQCQSRNELIPRGYRCDRERDCSDSSDELSCGRPFFIGGFEDLTKRARKGETVTFKLTVGGQPLPRIVWRMNWKCLPQGDSRYSISVQFDSACRQVVSTLTIRSVQESDSAIFTGDALAGSSQVFSKQMILIVLN